MLYRDILKILGIYFMIFAAIMLIPFFLACYYQFFVESHLHPQPHSSLAFLVSIGVCFATGSIFYWFGRKSLGHIFKKEAVAIVVMVWFLTPVMAALPFVFSNTLSNPLQAYFEAVSGLTTTGSSVMEPKKYDAAGKEILITKTLDDIRKTTYSFYGTITPIRDPTTNAVLYTGVEAVNKALLFWRSFLQWMGGLGTVILFIAVFPFLGMSGKALYRSEMTGPIKEAITPRVGHATMQLWGIYTGLTVLQIFLLSWTNHKMEWLDSVTTAFGTLSGGGFSIRNDSIGYYHNATTDWIVVVFMILGSTKFTLFYHALRGQFYRIYQPELFVYLAILFVCSGIGTWALVGSQKVLLNGESAGVFSISEAIRYATFQIVSTQTSTGYVTISYDSWPYFIQAMMLILMFVGGMAGSTTGGMKVIRHCILFRLAQSKVESLFRTESVKQLKFGDQEIDSNTASSVLIFFWVAIAVAAFGTLLYILDGIDFDTAFSMIACMNNNVGVGFRMTGPSSSFAFLSDGSLLLSSILMIMGRLEFLVVLTVLVPSFWRKVA